MNETVGELIARVGKDQADLIILAESIKARLALARILELTTDPVVRRLAAEGLDPRA